MSAGTNAERRSYDPVAQLLHWTIALLIVVQVMLAEYAEDLPSGIEKLSTLARHKSFGMTVLALAAVRLIWRLTHRPPPAPPMPTWQRYAAGANHWAMYALLFAVPVTGWTMSSAANFPVSWFGLFTWPDLVGQSEALAERLEEVHEALAKTLVVLALVHLAAALKHQFIDRDGLLFRMLPGREPRS